MRYRYYIGLQLPPETSNHIADLQRELYDPIESVEPLEPHITLLPPPAVEQVDPDSIAIHAKAAAKDLWPMAITLTAVRTFQGHAIALAAESKTIHELQERLVALLPFETDIRYYPNPRFAPHVTLAQAIRGRTLPSGLIAQYEEYLAPKLPITFTVDHLTLFEWLSPRTYKARKI